MSEPIKITSQVIKKALAEKHWQDVFIPECKTGASYGKRLLILDGWATNKSWAQACTTGYEIKISRGDFLQDDKWPGYLPYCNKFYFVCPPGLIQVDEVGPEAGLMYVSKTGTRLYIKKKAPHRDVTVPEDLYRYLLMNRLGVLSNQVFKKQGREYWEEWEEEKSKDQLVGHTLSRKLAKAVEKRVKEVIKENERLLEEQKQVLEVKKKLKEKGLDLDSKTPWELRGDIEKLAGKIPLYFENYLSRFICAAKNLQESLKTIQDQSKPQSLEKFDAQ